MPLLLCRPKDAASRKSFDTNRTLRRWANRGCYKQPVNKRPVYAACTHECVSSAFGASGTAQTKDLACYQHLGKSNSVPGHHHSKGFSGIASCPPSPLSVRYFSARSGSVPGDDDGEELDDDGEELKDRIVSRSVRFQSASVGPLSVRFCLRRG